MSGPVGKGARGLGKVVYPSPKPQKKRYQPMRAALLSKGFTDESMANFAGLKYENHVQSNQLLLEGLAAKGFSKKSMRKIVRTAPSAKAPKPKIKIDEKRRESDKDRLDYHVQRYQAVKRMKQRVKQAQKKK